MFSLDSIANMVESLLKKNGIDPAKVVRDIQIALIELNQRLERIEGKQDEILQAVRETAGDTIPAGYGDNYGVAIGDPEWVLRELDNSSNGNSTGILATNGSGSNGGQ